MADEQTAPDATPHPSRDESTPAEASDRPSTGGSGGSGATGGGSTGDSPPKKTAKKAAKKAQKKAQKKAPRKEAESTEVSEPKAAQPAKTSNTSRARDADGIAERPADTSSDANARVTNGAALTDDTSTEATPAGATFRRTPAPDVAKKKPAPRKSAKATKGPARARPRPGPVPRELAQPRAEELAQPQAEEPSELGSTRRMSETGMVAPSRPAPGSWAQAAWQAAHEPDQPPLRLAELAVAEFGPRVAYWAHWLRSTYRNPPATGIARLAAQQARRQTWGLLVTEAAGPLAPALHLSGTAAVRVLLVLRTAAAYGHDPTDPARASELLDLLGVGAASDGMERMALIGSALGRFGRPRRLTGALRLLLALSEEHDSLQRLVHRAVRFYQHRR
jgi:hypothetical protein